MKTTIYYFSGTGNSLKLAQDLADRIGNCTLEPMAKYRNTQEVAPGTEQIGVVFPVYFWGLPQLTIDFLKKLDPTGCQYTFAAATRGGSPSYSMSHINRILKKKGSKLNAAININLPSNYIVSSYYAKIAPGEEKQQQLFAAAEKQINSFAEDIKNRKNGVPYHNILTRPLIRFVNILFSAAAMKKTADKRYYTSEECNGCGLCAKVCPTANVTQENGAVSWHNNCQQCMACIQFCPQKAIHYRKDCSNRPRYHRPEIKAADISKQSA